MKRSFSLFVCLWTLCSLVTAQNVSPTWSSILSTQPETIHTQLISSSEKSIKVNVQVPGFYTTNVQTPRGEAKIISMPKTVSTAKAGEPNLPMTGIPAIIGDQARMNIRVVDAKFMDFEGIEVAPSKGDFSRQIDPSTVPYTYGDCYNKDAFFPENNVGLYEPYIIRDFRGQNMVVYPFAYNPVTKTLRVYYDLTVEMYKVDDKGVNVMETRKSNVVKLDPDFKSLYQRHFINYEISLNRYTPVDEEGDLLIICYDSFISSMTDFVNWKKTRGMHTTIVGTSTAGSTYSAIKTYIQNQYNANNNLTHVLLVGDVAQIPGYSYTGGGSSYAGKGDNPYGQVVGNDIYNDLFIGRFSAQNTTQVNTQVQKVLTYERDLTAFATWCQNGLGVSTTAGNGGHNSEDDYQHIENLRTDLLDYGYTTVYQDYKNVSGYPTSTTTTISDHINSGVGIINYCNHGSQTSWGSHSYSNSHVNALTNSNKLPFIFSVACLNGKYDYSSDCFAEAWMRATNNSTGAPTGAIGTMMSYISQPWIPPMWAQDEFVDILVESYSNNIKRTWGGAAINGIMSIFDHYSTSEISAVGTYQAWILYGDPTLILRTKTPQTMTVNHVGTLTYGMTSYTVNVNNGNGALATITNANHDILGSAMVNNGTAVVNLSGSYIPGDELTLCVFGYNKVTYLGTISVVGGTQYSITCNATEHGSISAPELAYPTSMVTLTATPDEGYCLSTWDVRDADNNPVAVNNNTFVMPESDVTVSATFVQGLTVMLASVMNGSISATPTCTLQGTIVNLTATPNASYKFCAWTVFKTDDVNTTVTVNDNSFIMPNFDVTVSACFEAFSTEDVTVGSGNSNSNYIPTYIYYKYTLSEQIYTPSEIDGAGTITAIAFRNSNDYATSRNLDIYMKHTTKTSFSSASDRENLTTSYRVFSGTVNVVGSGWTVITLDTPFEYNGTSNLLIGVDDNSGSWISNYPRFHTNSTSTYRSVYIASDDTDYNPALATSYSNGYNSGCMQMVNQVRFTKEVSGSSESLSVSPNTLSGFTYSQGNGPSEVQSFSLIGSGLEDNLTVTAPTHFEIGQNETGIYANTITFTPSNGGLQKMVYVRLKADLLEGNYDNESLTLASGNISQTIILSGNVTQSAQVYQTVNFASGWNWWSTNLDITLAQLEEALGTNGIAIKSQEHFNSYSSLFGWIGDIEEIVPEQMYKINVSQPCSITLTGIALNPEGLPITIKPGSNWIGCPIQQSMSIGEAFANFSPADGDIIRSASGFSTYSSIMGWLGDVETLEHGVGYIYISRASMDKTLVFPQGE